MSPLFCLAKIWWRPGIGDPYPLAWAITAAYLLATVLSIWAGRRERRALRQANAAPLAPRFWFVVATVMFLMGCNKQLDLQTLVLQLEWETVRFAGWHWTARPLELAFVLVYAVLGGGLLIGGLIVMRSQLGRYGLAFAGLGCLLTFVVVRAAVFHRVDPALYRMLHPRLVNTVLELGGVVLVAVAALAAGRNASRLPLPDGPRIGAGA